MCARPFWAICSKAATHRLLTAFRRLAWRPNVLNYLIEQAEQTPPGGAFIGIKAGQVKFFSLEDLPRMLDTVHKRPKEQWWLDLRPIARLLAQPGPQSQ